MKQKGFVLIVSLIFVVIMTMLALAMFSGLSTDEAMSGNHREKSRSRDAAQTALNLAEFWLTQGNNSNNGNWVGNGYTITCAGVLATATICTNSIPANVLTTPSSWPSYYSPPAAALDMTVNAAGGVNTYAGNTQIYIQFLGVDTSSSPPPAFYQVTAAAVGGNATATTVVQSVYEVTCASCCRSC